MTDDSSSLLFGEQTIQFLRHHGLEATFAAGEAIMRRGQEGHAFYVVLDGEVEICLDEGKGRRLPLARLSEGASFGELSALRGSPISADVVALTPVRLLVYPAEQLPTALAECEPLRRKVLARLARNLQQATSKTWALFRHAQVLSSPDLQDDTPELVGTSARSNVVRKQIPLLAADSSPGLVAGAPGTGRLLTARLIHLASERRHGPLIVIDCRNLPTGDAIAPLFGASSSAAPDQAEGLGAAHLAHGGTLVLRHVDELCLQDQQQLAHQLELRQGADTPSFPDLRLLVTTDELGDEQQLHPQLLQHLEHQLLLPRLAQRRRDIVPLARHFLASVDADKPLHLATSAEHALLARSYQHRNVAELEQVIQLAVQCADGTELRAEHIFSTLAEEAAPYGLPLPGRDQLRRLLRWGWLGWTRVAVLGGFLAAIGLCLSSSVVPTAGALANAAVWRLWEPVVFALFLLVGSVWCTVCPLSTAGRLTQRLGSLELPAPSWSRTLGPVISAAGFVLIIWIELYFDTTRHPAVTGFLLLGLIAASVLCCLLYQRELWCRDLCPLGRLAEVLAPGAPLTLAARREVCASQCTTHECFKGDGEIPGCTVHHHPQQTNEAHRCKLCLDCLASCPHGSVGLYLRPPVQGVLRLDHNATRLLPFALVVCASAVVMVASRSLPALQYRPVITGALLVCLGVCVPLGLVMNARSRIAASGARSRVVLSLLLLGWGMLMAYQIDLVPVFDVFSLGAVPDTWAARVLSHPVLLPTIGKIAIIVVSMMAAISAVSVTSSQHSEGKRFWVLGVLLVVILAAAYAALGLWLVVAL